MNRYAKARPRRTPGQMNRLERAYADLLEQRQRSGEIVSWAYESVTLKLAPRTTYTPDFFFVDADGACWFVETKGFPRDDAIVKFKVAAERFPWAHWRMVKRKGGAWETMYEF